jgi:hypothetical protein
METILKLLFLCGIIVITAFSCIKIADTAPGISVYKTKGDYFNMAFVFMNSSGIYGKMAFYNPRSNSISRFKITETDTIYIPRAKLIDGYMLVGEHNKDMVFLNLTLKEYLRYEIKNGHPPTDDELYDNILDDDPFIEYYYDQQKPRRFEMSDTAEINQIIENGELEKYFKRIK